MSSLNTKPRLTRLGHKGWDNLWLCANIKILVLRITRTDPWSIGDIGILDNNQLANGPGISLLVLRCM